MNQGAREQIRSLYADQVMPLANQQLGSTTVSGLADVRRSSSGTDDQQRPRVDLGPVQVSEAHHQSDDARSISSMQGETMALQLGASGPQVQALQSHLRELGYRDLRGQPLGTDGIFDGHTRQAVARFQDDMGLSPSGVADEATQRVVQASVQWQIERQRQTAQTYDPSGREAGSDNSEQARRAKDPVAGAPTLAQPPIATVMPFSNPLHRHHQLYAQAQAQTQAAGYDFSEARLTQITEALVKGDFGTKGRPWELQMHSDGKRLCFNDPNTVVGGRAMVDVTLPEPSIAAVVGKVDAADERTAALMQEWQQQRATQAQQGPMLG